jgi:hypothetical protein
MRAIQALTIVAAVVAYVAAGDRVRASSADAQRILGLEAPADWTVENGTIVGSSTVRTQGNGSLAVQAHGYTVVRSRLLGPLGAVSPNVSVDVRLPPEQPNPAWLGAFQVFVTAPSIGLNNAYVGEHELTGLSLETFHTLTFALPSDIQTALDGSYFDLSVSLVLNVPTDATGTYLVDNVQVSASIPGDSTITQSDIPRILGFEQASDWQVLTGTTNGVSPVITNQGSFSLAVHAVGYTTITSLPMPSIAPVDPEVSFQLWLPPQQPDPSWFGAAQLFVSAPSLNLYNAYVGQQELTGLPTGQFNKLTFTLPSDVRAALDSTAYSDLRFTIVLNVPAADTGIYYLDNLDVGPITRPQEPPTGPFRNDLVGVANGGVAVLTIEDHDFSLPVTKMGIYVESLDGNCMPSEERACRFVVHNLFVRIGAFSIEDTHVSQVVAEAETPFQVTLGGGKPLTTNIPSYVRFLGVMNGDFGRLAFFPSSSQLRITINPAGDGLIVLSGALTGRIEDHNFSIGLSITAGTPLTNRMPLPKAGPDQTVTSTTCVANVTLDGSASTDPDGNLSELRWLQDGVTIGRNAIVSTPIQKSGVYLFRLVARDAFFGEAADDVQVTVQLGSGCP